MEKDLQEIAILHNEISNKEDKHCDNQRQNISLIKEEQYTCNVIKTN